MLDLEHQTTYDVIRAVSGDDDVYKVVEADEIIERLPAGLSVSKVQLSSIIRDLKDMGYLDVKYFTPDEYCLLVVKRIDERVKQPTSVAQEDEQKPAERTLYGEQKKKEQKQQKPVGAVRVFFASFFGTLIASGIVAVVTVLIIKFV